MKKILKFLLPVPSIAILVFCGILLCFGEVDGVHIQIKDWLMFMVILFIFLILPLDIVFLAIKKIYFKLKLKREKINNPQPQPQPTIKAKSIPEKQKYEKEIDMYFIKERVNELLRNPKELLRFYADKLASTWLNPTFQTVQLASVDRQTEKNKEYIKELDKKLLEEAHEFIEENAKYVRNLDV